MNSEAHLHYNTNTALKFVMTVIVSAMMKFDVIIGKMALIVWYFVAHKSN